MNTSMIKINQTDVSVKEYKNQRVVTFKEVDEVHQRPEGTARVTFNRCKKHFKKDVDFFVCDTYEAQELFGIAAPNGLTLLAESGYLMLVKPFTDDLSWDVQRQLVNCYFRVKAQQTGQPTEYHKALAESKLNNSRARLSSVWLKLADRVEIPEFKQVCAHYASTVLAGHEILPLPESGEKYLSATEVGELFGVTAQRIGLVANANELKTEEFGKWYHDKSRYSDKQVNTFKYNHKAIERFSKILGQRGTPQ